MECIQLGGASRLWVSADIYRSTVSLFKYCKFTVCVYLTQICSIQSNVSLFLCRVGYILNVTREIDNFFPGTFCYCNIRVYDNETTDLLAHWNETYNFIVRAK